MAFATTEGEAAGRGLGVNTGEAGDWAGLACDAAGTEDATLVPRLRLTWIAGGGAVGTAPSRRSGCGAGDGICAAGVGTLSDACGAADMLDVAGAAAGAVTTAAIGATMEAAEGGIGWAANDALVPRGASEGGGRGEGAGAELCPRTGDEPTLGVASDREALFVLRTRTTRLVITFVADPVEAAGDGEGCALWGAAPWD